ncbi:MAG TPA: helix-turn-helix domain-containing protein [Gemmatimonadales bacterium]|nr:helix-turn-helix domain-containing protein [Gemmatimonadales bacterium]
MEDQDLVERVETIMSIIAGKWKPAIIYALVTDGPVRFLALRRRIPRVSQRMLTRQLRDLERYGIVERAQTAHGRQRVEYSVTPLGRTLHPIFKSVCDWGGENFPAMARARARYEKRASEGSAGRRAHA